MVNGLGMPIEKEKGTSEKKSKSVTRTFSSFASFARVVKDFFNAIIHVQYFTNALGPRFPRYVQVLVPITL